MYLGNFIIEYNGNCHMNSKQQNQKFFWRKKHEKNYPNICTKPYFCFFPFWLFLLFVFKEIGGNEPWGTLRLYVAQGGLFIAFLLGLGWLTWFVDRHPKDADVGEFLRESSLTHWGIPRGMMEEARAMRKLHAQATTRD